jgi:uncharacterized protein (TIRG00374 family)
LINSSFKYKKWVAVSAAAGFVAFVVYLFYFTDFEDVAIVIGQTNVPIYLLALLCAFVSITLNALTWHRILGSLAVKTTFTRAFNLSWVGIFVDSFVPGGWSGDIFKAYLLAKDQKGTAAKVTASIVVKNVFEIVLTLATLIVGIVLLALNYTVDSVVIVAIGVTLVFLAFPLVVVVYLSMNVAASRKLLGILERVFRVFKRQQTFVLDAESKIQSSLNEFHDGVMIIKTNPKALLPPVILQTLTWVFDILTRLLIFMAIGYAISPDKIIITSTIVISIQTQGIAFTGFAQVASSAIYSVLGIPALISVTSSLLAGFATFWFKTAVAFVPFEVIVFARCVPFFCKKCEGIGKARACKDSTAPAL